MKRRLTDEEKVYIISNFESKSLGRLSQILNRPRMTIKYFYKRWLFYKKISNAKPKGRPEILSKRDKARIVAFLRNNPMSSLRQVKQALSLSCCPVTISKALHKMGFRKYKMKVKPKLLAVHKAKRYDFAVKYLNWRLWDRVLFTDECSVEYFKRYSKKVWRKPGEALKDGMFISKDVEYSKKYIKIWSCFSSNGTGKVIFIEPGEWNGKTYLKILKENIISEGQRLIGSNFILMHDGDTVHRYSKAKEWLSENRVRVLEDWPAKSCDINPLENLWFLMKARLASLPFVSLDNFKANIIKVMDEIGPSTCRSLVQSVQRRLAKVMVGEGKVTKY
jgi:hypothetical protein